LNLFAVEPWFYIDSFGRKMSEETKKTVKKDRAAEIANTFEWLITAFILAFVFRGFVMEAFRIPTGSMADTLRGAHFQLRCDQCGYRYDYGFDPTNYGYPADTIPRGDVRPVAGRCPSCGHYQPVGGPMPISNGDRILVLKCIYQFFEAKQWDVVVFKNPTEPSINYIKRLIGRPLETVELIDGDVYIDGQISRKPPKVQNELWMPVYDNDYQPVRPDEPSFNRHKWRQPFENTPDSRWLVAEDSPTIFRLNSPAGQTNVLAYNASAGNSFRTAYAYNVVEAYDHMPFCSDLMVRYYVDVAEGHGSVGAELSKYESRYRGQVDFSGIMTIAKSSGDGEFTELCRAEIEPVDAGSLHYIQFENVDHRLILTFGEEKLVYDLGRGPDDAGERKNDIIPQVKILGSGSLAVSHVAVFRDIHYTQVNGRDPRAAEGNPLKLEEGEYFVLGDNSPNSADSRWWEHPGRGNNGVTYPLGIVPREYMVGKALWVYLPGFFRPVGKSSPLFVPNIGRMRLVYGGSDRNDY
jgi:signal peptidase I